MGGRKTLRCDLGPGEVAHVEATRKVGSAGGERVRYTVVSQTYLVAGRGGTVDDAGDTASVGKGEGEGESLGREVCRTALGFLSSFAMQFISLVGNLWSGVDIVAPSVTSCGRFCALQDVAAFVAGPSDTSSAPMNAKVKDVFVTLATKAASYYSNSSSSHSHLKGGRTLNAVSLLAHVFNLISVLRESRAYCPCIEVCSDRRRAERHAASGVGAKVTPCLRYQHRSVGRPKDSN